MAELASDNANINACFEEGDGGRVAPMCRRHSRHTTAVRLLKAGVDFATIGQGLGHASLNTTRTHARADIDLTRQALMHPTHRGRRGRAV